MKTKDEIINYVKTMHINVSVSPTYSNVNRLQFVCQNRRTLVSIKDNVLQNNGHIEKYGNLTSYVLYSIIL